jgi:hypothetical protein
MNIGYDNRFDLHENFHGKNPNFELFGREKRVVDAEEGILILGGTAVESINRFASLTGRHKLNPLLGDKIIDKPTNFEDPHYGRHHISRVVE